MQLNVVVLCLLSLSDRIYIICQINYEKSTCAVTLGYLITMSSVTSAFFMYQDLRVWVTENASLESSNPGGGLVVIRVTGFQSG